MPKYGAAFFTVDHVTDGAVPQVAIEAPQGICLLLPCLLPDLMLLLN